MADKSKTKKFPEVQGGGSLILAWRIKDKKVLVVGGGEVCDSGYFYYSHISHYSDSGDAAHALEMLLL